MYFRDGPCLREFFNIFKRQAIMGCYQQLHQCGDKQDGTGACESSTAAGTQEVRFLTDENGSFCPYRGPELTSWIHYVPASVMYMTHLAVFLPYQQIGKEELSLWALDSLLWDQLFFFFFLKIYQDFSPVANEFRTWLETSCTLLPPRARELECHEERQQGPEPICGTLCLCF